MVVCLMIDIAICDDVNTDIETVKQIISNISERELLHVSYHIFEFNSAEAFLKATQKNHFDAVFMDVQLDGISGKEAANLLRAKDEKMVLCIISRNVMPAPGDFELDTYRYIMKDDNYENIYQNIYSVLKETIRRKEIPYLYGHIKSENRELVKKIELDDIYYISKLKYGSEVHLEDETYVLKEPLKNIIDLLCRNGFGMAHNSYMVNYRKIVGFISQNKNKALKLENGEILNISRSYREKFMQDFFKLHERGSKE